MKNKYLKFISAVILIILILLGVCFYLFSTYGEALNRKIYLSSTSVYPISTIIVYLGIYHPEPIDVELLYGKISFNQIKWIVERKNMILPFLPLSASSTKTELLWLLEHTADINNYSIYHNGHITVMGETVLLRSFRLNRLDLLQFLLDNGANPNMKFIVLPQLNKVKGLTYKELENNNTSFFITREYLESNDNDDAKYLSKEINLLKKYEEKYNKEYPNWENEWVFDW